ncbi:hypothetical protein PCANC_01649 [Puccinia coronata f. sp. avenae]|uniref:Uncharacterized protein n=1 Tax=Puccinia coronata f. sp. avenae TaxID=200324 RepID=A0A2N5W3A0_9BASI|nr:hypothetical protein PCANC_01649 [Puccinia coronata f. sp. avenae]
MNNTTLRNLIHTQTSIILALTQSKQMMIQSAMMSLDDKEKQQKNRRKGGSRAGRQPTLLALTGRTRQFERCSNSRVRPVVGQALSDRSTCWRVGQACPISSWDRLHRTSRDRSDKSVRPVGSRFGRTVFVRPLVKHGCSSTARAAVFDRLMPAVLIYHVILKPANNS